MNEMTYENSGQVENDPSMWPSDEEMRRLAVESLYRFEDYFYVRRYLTLKQMEVLGRAASASTLSFRSAAIGYINLTCLG